MRPMPNSTDDDFIDYDDRPLDYDPNESVTVPGLGFNGTVKTISRFLRRLFGRPAPKPL
jgi:hypothetical protein